MRIAGITVEIIIDPLDANFDNDLQRKVATFVLSQQGVRTTNNGEVDVHSLIITGDDTAELADSELVQAWAQRKVQELQGSASEIIETIKTAAQAQRMVFK